MIRNFTTTILVMLACYSSIVYSQNAPANEKYSQIEITVNINTAQADELATTSQWRRPEKSASNC